MPDTATPTDFSLVDAVRFEERGDGVLTIEPGAVVYRSHDGKVGGRWPVKSRASGYLRLQNARTAASEGAAA